jgi:hypothetical protein
MRRSSWIDLDLLEVGDPPALHRLLPGRVLLEGENRPIGVVEQEGRSDAVILVPLDDLSGRHGHDRIHHRGLGAGDGEHPDAAVDGVARTMADHRVLGRLGQYHHRK